MVILAIRPIISEDREEETMSYIALAIGMFLTGLTIGILFTVKHWTEMLKKSFKDMTEEDVIRWYHRTIKP